MKKIKNIVLVAFILMTSFIFGQQDAQYTQYMYNMNVINPAYAGSEGTLNIGLLGRTQWVNLPGAPKTFTATINAPVSEHVGLGLSIISDEIGPVKEQNVYADFSYTIPTSEIGKLAFGLKGGFSFQNIDYFELSTNQASDPMFANNLNKTYPNFGFGAFYYTNKFYVGLSMPNLLKSRYFEKKGGIVSSASEQMHYFLTSGYVFELSQDVKLKPSIMYKAVTGAPISMDYSLNALLYNKLEIGVSYRVGDSYSGTMNFLVTKNLRIGYAYDYTVSNLSAFNSGSHEVFLLYNVDFSRADFKSPRFF